MRRKVWLKSSLMKIFYSSLGLSCPLMAPWVQEGRNTAGCSVKQVPALRGLTETKGLLYSLHLLSSLYRFERVRGDRS